MKPQIFPLGITFDDVLLLPQKSTVSPKEVGVKTKFSQNIILNIPLVSAPMDTVTESKLAVALASEGGLGIIHRNLSPQRQAEEVAKVKRSRNSFIENPITLTPNDKISDAVRIRHEKGYKNIPIVDKKGKLLGLITKFDYFWPEDEKLPIKKLMKSLKEITIAPEGITLNKARQIIKEKRVPIILIVDKKGYLKSIVTRSDLEKNLLYPQATKDSQDRLRVGGAIGVGTEALKRAHLMAEVGVDALVIDTAHGHSKKVMETLKILKKDKVFKNIDIVAGNVATTEATRDLINLGADAIKVGVGPGSICTTRVITGVGVPQITAIQNAIKGRNKANIPLIADGGIRYSGDIVKALAAGADSVMIGKLFAATEESPGEITYYNGRMYKVHRGMGSLEAMTQGARDRYGQSLDEQASKLIPEGIVGQILYKGKLADHVHQLVGGLCSGMGYVGAKDIQELHQKAKFIQITEASIKESHPHNITITKEAPNYQRMEM